MRPIHPLAFWASAGFLFGCGNAVVHGDTGSIAVIEQGIGSALFLTFVGSFVIWANRRKKPWERD